MPTTLPNQRGRPGTGRRPNMFMVFLLVLFGVCFLAMADGFMSDHGADTVEGVP